MELTLDGSTDDRTRQEVSKPIAEVVDFISTHIVKELERRACTGTNVIVASWRDECRVFRSFTFVPSPWEQGYAGEGLESCRRFAADAGGGIFVECVSSRQKRFVLHLPVPTIPNKDDTRRDTLLARLLSFANLAAALLLLYWI